MLPLAMVATQVVAAQELVGATQHGERESGTWVFHHEHVLGTSLELKVKASSAREAKAAESAALAEFDRQDKILSAWRADSEFSRWEKTRLEAVPVSPELMEVLADEDRTILFSSHNTQDVEQISDEITFIDRGKIIDSDNKEIFLDHWRRLRLVLPQDIAVPHLPGVIDVGGSSRLPVLTTNRFDPAMLSVCQDLGATVQAVDNMTLEEIFVTSVQCRRETVTL